MQTLIVPHVSGHETPSEFRAEKIGASWFCFGASGLAIAGGVATLTDVPRDRVLSIPEPLAVHELPAVLNAFEGGCQLVRLDDVETERPIAAEVLWDNAGVLEVS